MDHILSVDLGTTAIKVALFDAEGTVLSKATREYSLLTPSTLAVELPAEAYWQAWAAAEELFPDRAVDLIALEEATGSLRAAIQQAGIEM